MIFVTDISIPWRTPARYPTRVFAVNPASLIARFCFTRCPLVSPSDFHGLNRGIENP
jgi:hypothetical protein